MSKQTAAASRIDCNGSTRTLMMSMELGESGWLLGFASAYGQKPLRRKIATRDWKALLAQIAWAKRELGMAGDAPVASCYEAGRDGFWLHRFLTAHGVENLVVDSASIEVNRRKRRAKSDRIDLVALLDLLARHRAGSSKPVWSVVRVPSQGDEDRRHLGRSGGSWRQACFPKAHCFGATRDCASSSAPTHVEFLVRAARNAAGGATPLAR